MDNSIKRMFSSISRNYDLMNTLITFGLHKYWRAKSVKLSGVKKGDTVLDLGAGTGDFAIAFKKKVGLEGKVIAVDFSKEMLDIFKEKIDRNKLQIEIINKDVMELEFPKGTFDFITMAFGLRNFVEPFKLINKISNFLKPYGKVVILETGQPKYPMKILYLIYAKLFIPVIGKIFAVNKSAYEYLINTAAQFSYGKEMAIKLCEIENISYVKIKKFLFGVVYLYICTVSG